ncbi:hypothetical protein [Glaciimonas immobilis]|nr:hypothetical protein [Glaciimonas immobilis]
MTQSAPLNLTQRAPLVQISVSKKFLGTRGAIESFKFIESRTASASDRSILGTQRGRPILQLKSKNSSEQLPDKHPLRLQMTVAGGTERTQRPQTANAALAAPHLSLALLQTGRSTRTIAQVYNGIDNQTVDVNSPGHESVVANAVNSFLLKAEKGSFPFQAVASQTPDPDQTGSAPAELAGLDLTDIDELHPRTLIGEGKLVSQFVPERLHHDSSGKTSLRRSLQQPMQVEADAKTIKIKGDKAASGELIYNFKSWGQEHAVRISHQSGLAEQQKSAVLFHPTSSLVEQRLNEQVTNKGPNWVVQSTQDEQREGSKQYWTVPDEEEQ